MHLQLEKGHVAGPRSSVFGSNASWRWQRKRRKDGNGRAGWRRWFHWYVSIYCVYIYLCINMCMYIYIYMILYVYMCMCCVLLSRLGKTCTSMDWICSKVTTTLSQKNSTSTEYTELLNMSLLGQCFIGACNIQDSPRHDKNMAKAMQPGFARFSENRIPRSIHPFIILMLPIKWSYIILVKHTKVHLPNAKRKTAFQNRGWHPILPVKLSFSSTGLFTAASLE